MAPTPQNHTSPTTPIAPWPSDTHQDGGEQGLPRPLSGPGTSRQTRRLQLRNAGFRGGNVPARKVTPKSVSSSTWSTMSGVQGYSDVENVSPAGRSKDSTSTTRRKSSGILQEIGNSSYIAPKKTRQRVTSKAFDSDTADQEQSYMDSTVPTTTSKSTIRPRTVKNRAKMSYRRRSVSAETSKYIEHLETELAETQSRLSSITSPSVTREQSSRVRNLNVETRQLQEEIAEWESKYEQRVQEEVDRYYEIETGLRARIRSLEQEADETRFKVEELETQLQTTTENMEAVETANVNLEKRIEIMSELLASSKIDLHAQSPGRSKKHVRPRSMLPRFPTASSLTGSPERHPQTQPASPLVLPASISPSLPPSPSHGAMLLDGSPDQTDYTSEAESVFSEASAAGDSVTSAETFDHTPSFNPWSLPAQQTTKPKPVRRMRRFGAGSMGPKPLILPSTSHYDPYPPTSAPPLERSETTPALIRPRSMAIDDTASPIINRRRASTTPHEMTLRESAGSMCADLPAQESVEDTIIHQISPSSADSRATSHRVSSLGSAIGRNLMEELCAVRSDQTATNEEPDMMEDQRMDELSQQSQLQDSTTDDTDDASVLVGDEAAFQLRRPIESSPTSAPAQVEAPAHRRSRSRTVSIPSIRSESMFDRLRILFGDLWRSPVAMARYLVQAAQTQMRIPRPLVNVQWWLVGVLLGPMAKRRMLAGSGGRRRDLEEQPLLLENAMSGSLDNNLAYGTLYQTPPTSPGRGSSGRSGDGRASPRQCVHQRTKHSPWLWIKFSITLAFAIGAAFKDGPSTLLKNSVCKCRRDGAERVGSGGRVLRGSACC